MRKTTIWLIIATSLVLLGCILFGGVMMGLQWDFFRLSTKKYETNTYAISDAFSDISVETDTADIVFAMSDDDKCRVECHEEANAKHFVAVEDNTLVVRLMDERSWRDHIGINFDAPKITVYLPKAEYTSLRIRESTGDITIQNGFTFAEVTISLTTGDVAYFASASGEIRIQTSTGDIRVENIAAGALNLSVSTGKVTVSQVSCQGDVTVGVSTGKVKLAYLGCKNLTSTGNTGDISLQNVVAAETFSIERSTGDVRLDSVDAAEIFIQTDTGDVSGTLRTAKVFVAKTDTGRVDVPQTTTGGRCEIITGTGDIKMEIR